LENLLDALHHVFVSRLACVDQVLCQTLPVPICPPNTSTLLWISLSPWSTGSANLYIMCFSISIALDFKYGDLNHPKRAQ
jgi:hypothetical protein